VGDGEEELLAALREGLEADLCVVTGGLGPTHDDRTVELVARAAGVGLHVDDGLRAEIEAFSRAVAERLGRPYADFETGVVKQATIPDGAVSLGLAGTAPGLALATEHGAVVVLPGPPRELQRLWPAALASEPVRVLLDHATAPEHRVLRFYGASESEVARALAEAGGEPEGVAVTICARDFEIHVDLYGEADGLADAFRGRLARYLFSEREVGVEQLVLDECRARGWTLATAESITGGMIGERLTRVPGASEVFVGSVVAYANEVKERELGVTTIAEHGAVSAETAAAMAAGVRERLGADVGIAVTGIAGPGGQTPEKPVGLVYVHVETPERSRGLDFVYGADRDSIRRRATVAALHLARQLVGR
jgi:PncC family amidohydrolase